MDRPRGAIAVVLKHQPRPALEPIRNRQRGGIDTVNGIQEMAAGQVIDRLLRGRVTAQTLVSKQGMEPSVLLRNVERSNHGLMNEKFSHDGVSTYGCRKPEVTELHNGLPGFRRQKPQAFAR